MGIKLFFIFLLLTLNSFSQIAPSKFRIQFTDKDNSPYTISNPAAFLSQKAIDRRNNQGISIQPNDLPVNPAYIDSVRNTGVTLLNRSKWFNSVTIDTTGANDPLVLDEIQSFSFVVEVESVGKWKTASFWDEVWWDKWEMEKSSTISISSSLITSDYGQSFNQISMVGGDILHEQGYRGEGMVIAVLDAGFYKVDSLGAFDSLWANSRILGTWDFVDGEAGVFEKGPHGMWVLSVMAANLPGQLVGTAPEANYWLLRTEDTGSELVIEEDNWVAAAEFADSAGADIFNTSLGYTTFDDPNQNHTYADMDGNTTRITIGADIAASKGILVVNAAGNQGGAGWKYIVAPADGDSVLTVGAVDASGSYASFSSQGPSFDGRVKPNIVAQGLATITASDNGGVQALSGTSVASPIIAGLAACLWQAHPSATNMQVFDAIQQSADQYKSPDNLKGYGIPDFALAHFILSNPDLPGFTNDQLINVFPSPFSENIAVIFYSSVEQDITIELFDIAGKSIHYEEMELLLESYNWINVNGLDELVQGFYILRLTSPGKTYVRKLSKM